MGLITTNSLRQTFNRRVVQAALSGSFVAGVPGEGTRLNGVGAGADGGRASGLIYKSAAGTPTIDAGTGAAGAKAGKAVAPVCGPSHLCFAIPDHPWVDSANGAAVRIAMTVLAPGAGEGAVLRVTGERTCDFGEVAITVQERRGLVHADLSVGANVAAAVPLRAMAGVSSPGVKLHGAGFIVTPDEAAKLLPDGEPLEGGPGGSQLLRDSRNGRDLTEKPRGVKVIDAFGWSAEDLRQRAPHVYQWLLERVKPERDAKGSTKDGAGYAKLWWLHGKPRQEMRKQLAGLPRYIATVETAKHRTFQFLDASILPDNKLIAIALQDALSLGVLSSRLHGDWALATGSWLGVGNDPVYVKSRCFETFPFPDTDTGLTPPLRERIAQLAEQIDAHRKRVLAPDTGAASNAALTLTGIYNVLTALREGRALTAKEKFIHTQGLVGVLRELHDELDAAVLAAYGLPAGASTDDILLHLVQLNTERAQEEAQGRVRWLRPEFQNLQKTTQKQELPAQEQQALEGDFEPEKPLSKLELIKTHQHPWPSTLPEQVRAVAEALARSPAPLTLPALEAHFKGRGPWKKGLPTLLQTLEALGRAQAVQVDGVAAWRG